MLFFQGGIMNRYWDMSEAARAELTEEQVKSFLDVELMEKGLVKIKPPVRQPLAVVELPKVKVACVKYSSDRYGIIQTLDVGFPTMEAAQAFLELCPVMIADDWETKTKWAAPLREASIFTEELTDHHVVLSAIVALKSNKAKEDANQKAERDYTEAMKLIDAATKDVWDDWQELRAAARAHQRVLDTKAEYEKLAGNADIALSFLLKAYPKPTIEAACEWRGIPSPFTGCEGSTRDVS